MAPFAALVSVIVAVALPAAPGSVGVRVVTDIAECPSPGEVRSALRQALGEGEHAAGGWTLWYGRDSAVPAAEREASLSMELADPMGERLVSRRILTSAGDCAAIGTVMAAVVERSLRDLGWTRGEPLTKSAQPAKPTEVTVSKPAETTDAVQKKHVPRLVLGAGPVYATSSRVGTNLLLQARVRVAGPFCLRLGAAAFAGSASESLSSASTARVTLSSRSFTLSPLAAWVVGPVELAGGPVVLLAADHASSAELPRAGSGTRMVMAVGAGVGVAVPLSKRWRLGLCLEGFRVAFAPDTYVDWNGTRTTVLAPSPWQGMASARLEFVPWP
jgi:hypothetical protein